MKSGIIRSAFSILLLLVFLAGSTGITFTAHICGSDGKKQVIAFPEVFKKNVACCCETGATVPSSAASSIDNETCCQNIHGFIKADFLGFPVPSLNLEKSVFPTAVPLFYSFGLQAQDKEPSRFVYLTDPSPPPGGKALIVSIHQIKIPFSSSVIS